MSSNCTIEANPDIAGIGVRVSIYIQALLSLFPAGVALYKYGLRHTSTSNYGVAGEPEAAEAARRLASELAGKEPGEIAQHLRQRYDPGEKEEREEMRQTWLPVQVLGAALLTSAIIQAKRYGLSLYHALIVINLSWLNNITALGLALTELFLVDPVSFLFTRSRHPIQFLPLFICSLHLTATGAFSIWVFAHVDDFGDSAVCNSDIQYWVFGRLVSATAPGFRKAGLVISSIAVCPVLNLTIEIIVSGITGFILSIPGLILHIIVVVILAIVGLIIIQLCIPMERRGPIERFLEHLPIHTPARRIYSMGMQFAFLIIFFIIGTEGLISANRNLVQDGEEDWSFGQTLAMFVLLPVVLDVYSKLRRAWSLPIRYQESEEPAEPGSGERAQGTHEATQPEAPATAPEALERVSSAPKSDQ